MGLAATDSTTRQLEARRARGIQIAVALVLAVVVLRATPWTRGLFVFSLIENYAYDSAFTHFSSPSPPEQLIIVDIDDKSLQKLGRFQSWHRDIYASLLEGGLRDADVVAFDLLFTEPDESVGAMGATGVRGDVQTADTVFANAVARHGRVVLAAHWQPESAQPAGGKPPEIAFDSPGQAFPGRVFSRIPG